MIRIVFTADNHLNRYYAKMSREQLRGRRRKLLNAWRETVNFAISIRAHLYLHAGDLFDGSDPNPFVLAFVAREFQRLADSGVKVLAISGNHDMPRYMGESASPIRIYEELHAAHVFTKRDEVEFEVFEVEGQRVAIGGLAPDPRAEPDADPLAQVAVNPPPCDVCLLLLHGGVEDAVPEGFGDAVIRKSSIAALKGVDYLLIGDIHQTRKMTIEQCTVIIPGSTERMSFGELKTDAGFYYLELDGKQPIKLLHKEISLQPMRRLEIRSTNLPDDDPTGYICEEIRATGNSDQMLQLQLGGPVDRDLYHKIRFFDIWRLGNELNFFFDLDKSQLELRSPERGVIAGAPEERVDIERELQRAAAEMLEEAESDDIRTRIVDAAERVIATYRGGKASG